MPVNINALNQMKLPVELATRNEEGLIKAYRREVVDSIQPLIAHHFNLTVEMPLKAIAGDCCVA
jgi:dolichol-phosphate mannosyltransferase